MHFTKEITTGEAKERFGSHWVALTKESKYGDAIHAREAIGNVSNERYTALSDGNHGSIVEVGIPFQTMKEAFSYFRTHKFTSAENREGPKLKDKKEALKQGHPVLEESIELDSDKKIVVPRFEVGDTIIILKNGQITSEAVTDISVETVNSRDSSGFYPKYISKMITDQGSYSYESGNREIRPKDVLFFADEAEFSKWAQEQDVTAAQAFRAATEGTAELRKEVQALLNPPKTSITSAKAAATKILGGTTPAPGGDES